MFHSTHDCHMYHMHVEARMVQVLVLYSGMLFSLSQDPGTEYIFSPSALWRGWPRPPPGHSLHAFTEHLTRPAAQESMFPIASMHTLLLLK